MQDKELMPVQNSYLYKSNTFISAKYKSTLLENQITAIALTKIQQHIKGKDVNLIAEIYPSELKQILGSDSNIYRTLKNLRQTLGGRTILLEDGKGNFTFFPLIQKAEYNEGVFTIRFNDEIKPLISNLGKNFTPLEVSILTSVKSNSAYRFYELFEKEMYEGNIKYVKEKGCIVVDYNISELKFLIGICDIDDNSIKSERIRMGKNLDYDVLFNKLPKSSQKYVQSSDFIKRVVIPAQKELKEKSNIRFEYEGLKTKGNRIGKIRFYLYPNNNNETQIRSRTKMINDANKKFKNTIEEDGRQLEIPMDVNIELYEEFVGLHGITKDDIDVMLRKTNYDQAKVREAIYYVNNKEHVNGFTNYVMSVLNHPEWILDDTAVVNGSDLNPDLVKIGKDMRNNITKEQTKKKNPKEIWENVIKKRADFTDFVVYMQNKDNWGLDDFEAVFTYEEMIDYWKKWNDNK